MIEQNIKNIQFDNDVKHKKKKKKHYCPFCGNVMRARLVNKFMYCNRCHHQLPGIVMPTDDSPIKERKN